MKDQCLADFSVFLSLGGLSPATQSPGMDAPSDSNPASDDSFKGGVTVGQCQTMIRRSLRTPMARFLRENLEKSGWGIGDNFFKAINCETRRKLVVVISLAEGNHLTIQDEVNQVVFHELIHAYDECRTNVNWANCAHHACTEIRAGHLSGDCHYKRELLRGYMKIQGHEQECIRRRVMQSATANPNCPEIAAKDAMEAVWDICYNDAKPFDRAP